MSVKSAKALMEKIKSDPKFGKKIEDAKDNKARMAIIRSAGFDFTQEEMKQAVKPAEGELSDEDLEAVAGGSSAPWVAVGTGAAGAGAAAAAA